MIGSVSNSKIEVMQESNFTDIMANSNEFVDCNVPKAKADHFCLILIENVWIPFGGSTRNLIMCKRMQHRKL